MTITALLSLIKNKYFLIAVLAVCLVISGAITYKTIYKSGYNQGIVYQESIYQKAKDAKDAEDKAQQVKVDSERATLNTEISDLKDKLTAAQTTNSSKKQTIQDQVNQYAKSNKTVTSVCIPSGDNGLHILNQSFPSN